MSTTITTDEVIQLNDAIVLPPVEELHHVPSEGLQEVAQDAGALFSLGDLYLSPLTALLSQAGEMVNDRDITRRISYAIGMHGIGRVDHGADVAMSAYTEAVTGEPGHQIVSAWPWPGMVSLLYSMLLGIEPDEFPAAFVVVTSADRSRTVVLQDVEVVGTDAGEALATAVVARTEEGGPQE